MDFFKKMFQTKINQPIKNPNNVPEWEQNLINAEAKQIKNKEDANRLGKEFVKKISTISLGGKSKRRKHTKNKTKRRRYK
jgi:hypothetical protein